jgi:ubiquinone/menaquinone biosynthesis C-methylase UbiE
MAGHPIFAALYDRFEARAERAGLAEMRAKLLAGASGRVLELGAGTGANASHYTSAVTSLLLTEPDPHMARRLRAKLAAEPPACAFEVRECGAESLPAEDGSIDTVVSTLVLCTVGEPESAVSEVVRVLRPGGRLLLLEHVRDPHEARLAGWQDRLERPWGFVAAGCHPNRDTIATLAAAGFDLDGIEATRLPAAPPLVRPAVQGVALPPAG